MSHSEFLGACSATQRQISLIVFGGWANLAHAGLMAVQQYAKVIERRELAGVVVFAVVGVMLVVLTPAKQSVEKATTVVA